MKTCTVCERVLPDESFPADRKTRTQLASWCVGCYRKKRAEWKAQSPAHSRAWKEEERKTGIDPVHWANLHCQHISNYVTRVVARFEAKTGHEAPPQLLAIRQLADQLAQSLPERPKAILGGPYVVCRNCGREFVPKRRGSAWAAYCSSYCKNRIRQVYEAFESAGQGADK